MQALGGFAASLGQNFVAIGFGLVFETFHIRFGALNFVEGIDNLFGRIGLLQFDTDDFYAGAEFVKHFLQFGLGFVFNFAAVAGDNRLHFRLSDNFAQNRLGGDLNGDVRAAHVEEVVFGIFDAPDNSQVNVNDVFVAGQHVAFGERVAAAAVSGFADGDASFLSDADFFDAFNRVGQMVVQAGIGRVGISAETQNDALFAGLNLIKARKQPNNQQRKKRPADFEIESVVFFLCAPAR